MGIFRKLKIKKIAQCRYCVNSSNEGEGIWLGDLWLCYPCFNKFKEKGINLGKIELGD